MPAIPQKHSDDTLFENAFNFASIGMALVSTNGNFLKVNHSLCNLMGYTEEELLNLDFQTLTHPEDLEVDLELLEEVIHARRENYSLEKRYFHKNGSIVWVMLTVSVIRNPDKSPRFFISQLQDVSELKNTQQTLMNQSRMMALGEMSAGIAHEINNPLTVINLNATAIEMMVNEKNINPEMLAKFTFKINETVKRISAIVTSLRKFGRHININDSFEPAKMSQILNDALELCREKFKSYDIKLQVRVDEDIEVDCNPLEISQVMINLINNSFYAVKDCKEKWVTININGTGTHVLLSVTDSGVGIPTEARKRIMEPFFTTKPVGDGSGLGLSISKSIVQLHQGKIFLDETSTHTKFVVELPVRQKKKSSLPSLAS